MQTALHAIPIAHQRHVQAVPLARVHALIHQTRATARAVHTVDAALLATVVLQATPVAEAHAPILLVHVAALAQVDPRLEVPVLAAASAASRK